MDLASRVSVSTLALAYSRQNEGIRRRAAAQGQPKVSGSSLWFIRIAMTVGATRRVSQVQECFPIFLSITFIESLLQP